MSPPPAALRLPAAALVAVATLASACAKKPTGSYEVGAASGDSSAAAALRAEADALWAQRSDEAALKSALTKYEAVYAANPKDREVAAQLVRGWYFLGDALQQDPDLKNASFDNAIAWGKKCLAINETFTARLEKGTEKEKDIVDTLTKDDVPCMYWTASSLGKWAKLNGIVTSLKHLDTVKAYMTRIGQLQPDYFYHGPDRYWGAYYALIPSFSGRDLNLSRTHFDKSIAASPDYLGTQVLLAEAWAINNQDRETFKSVLEAVVAADPEKVPEIAPENRAEQAKARRLILEIDDHFAN
jgi:hypothetical protein